jgi:hypothetical protein
MADRTYTEYPVLACGSDTFRPVIFDYKLANAATAATLTSGNAETYSFTDGETLIIKVDGGSAQTCTFNTADFVSITAATAAEVAVVINADTTGCTASGATGSVVIVSDTTGSTSSVQDTGTGTESALGFSTTAVTGRDAAETWYPGMVLQRHASTDDVLIGWDGTTAPVAILADTASVSATATTHDVYQMGTFNSLYIRVIDVNGAVTNPTQDQIKLLEAANLFVIGGKHA